MTCHDSRSTIRIVVSIAILISISSTAAAAVLAPNDGSIAGGLQLWLRNPGTDFDGTTWTDSSGNSRDAVAAGADAPGTAGSVTSVSGSYSGNTFDTVDFSNTAADLMVSTDLNGNSGSSDWTIFVVYGKNNTNNLDRPAGIGSRRIGPPVGHLNLANDGSLRFDNGNNLGGATPESDGDLFLRAVRLDSGSMSQWYDGLNDYLNDVTPSGGAIPNPTSNDEFYIGDLRILGASASIAEVVVYNSALTEAQIDGVNEYLLNNLQSNPVVPEPSTFILATLGLLSLGMTRRRRRR